MRLLGLSLTYSVFVRGRRWLSHAPDRFPAMFVPHFAAKRRVMATVGRREAMNVNGGEIFDLDK